MMYTPEFGLTCCSLCRSWYLYFTEMRNPKLWCSYYSVVLSSQLQKCKCKTLECAFSDKSFHYIIWSNWSFPPKAHNLKPSFYYLINWNSRSVTSGCDRFKIFLTSRLRDVHLRILCLQRNPILGALSKMYAQSI